MRNSRKARFDRRGRMRVTPLIASALFLFGLGGAVVSAVASSGPSHAPSGADPAQAVTTGLAASKEQAMQAEADARSAARVSAPAKDPDYTPSPDVVPPRTSGINDAHQSPLPASEFEVSNVWSGPSPVAGEWWVVYAGASQTRGALVPSLLIYAEPEDPNQADQYFKEVGVFDDPLAPAPLHVLSASETTLTLDAVPFLSETTSGSASPDSSAPSSGGALQTLTFDMSSKTFAVL